MSLKCYSDWQLGAIQIDLTPLTLRITEDSAKQLVNSLQLTAICIIGLLGERNVFSRKRGTLWYIMAQMVH